MAPFSTFVTLVEVSRTIAITALRGLPRSQAAKDLLDQIIKEAGALHDDVRAAAMEAAGVDTNLLATGTGKTRKEKRKPTASSGSTTG